ncbi:MAG: Crp/Fnr family transcriptional regulator [Burkholderiaceae bacterium]
MRWNAGPGLALERLTSLPEPAQRALDSIGRRRRWRAGQTLAWAGQRVDSAFVVLSGRMRLRSFDSEGDEQILAWLPPGTFGGLALALSELPTPCDIVADESSEALHFERNALVDLLARDATTSLAIACMLGARLSAMMDAHLSQSFAPLADRVWATVMRFSRVERDDREDREDREDSERPLLRITQAELARAVGASRYRVGIELRRLEATGRIALARGRITVLQQAPTRPT